MYPVLLSLLLIWEIVHTEYRYYSRVHSALFQLYVLHGKCIFMLYQRIEQEHPKMNENKKGFGE
jgi:hypothetical protein